MPRRSRLLLIAALTLVVLLKTQPLLAHQVKLGYDVGATMHIEPNDVAKAGEPVLVWFALARKGGDTLPLEDCACELTIYGEGANADFFLKPPLRPLNAEGYVAIPAAEFIFPDLGKYELVLTGEAQGIYEFEPFELRFPVVVATGTPVRPTPTPAPVAENSDLEPNLPLEPDSPVDATPDPTVIPVEPDLESEPPVTDPRVTTRRLLLIIVGSVAGIVVGIISVWLWRKAFGKRGRK